jgi:hypothetical protein
VTTKKRIIKARNAHAQTRLKSKTARRADVVISPAGADAVLDRGSITFPRKI